MEISIVEADWGQTAESALNTTTDYLEPLEDDGGVILPDMTPIKVATAVAVLAAISQMTVVIISRGLTGDLSAKTLLMVQSLAEIAKQIVFVSYGSCALFGKDFCLREVSQILCQFTMHAVYVLVLLPDWTACLVAIDRFIAVKYGVWYKEHCSSRAAWIPIGMTLVVLISLGIPRNLQSHLTPGIRCLSTSDRYDQISALLGIPGVLIVIYFTAKLLRLIAQRRNTGSSNSNNNSNNRHNVSSITRALTWGCLAFAVSSVIAYMMQMTAFLITTLDKKVQRVFWFSLSNIVGSIGVMVRGWIYLTIEAMRVAFFRALFLKK